MSQRRFLRLVQIVAIVSCVGYIPARLLGDGIGRTIASGLTLISAGLLLVMAVMLATGLGLKRPGRDNDAA